MESSIILEKYSIDFYGDIDHYEKEKKIKRKKQKKNCCQEEEVLN